MKKLPLVAALTCMMIPSLSASLLAQGSLLGDPVNIRWLLNGDYLDPEANPGFDAFGVVVSSEGLPEYDQFNMGWTTIDIDATSIRFRIGNGGVGWANHDRGFTGFEIGDLDWQDAPDSRLNSIKVTINDLGLVDQGNGAIYPYSESNVTFGDDWVRILTAGYNMYPGFDIRVDLQAVPEPSSIGLAVLGALALVFRKRKAQGIQQ